MIIQKIFFKIRSKIKIIYYKIIYNNSLLIGKRFSCRAGLSILLDGDHAKLIIGEGVFFNNYSSINVMGEMRIGSNSIFGEHVKIYDHNHLYKKKDILIKNQGFSVKNVNIGNNCWIGSNVVILQGVSIGNNVIIGAGNVVYQSIPDNTIVINKQNQYYQSY